MALQDMELSSALLIAIEKYLAGTATPQEQQLVNEWYHSFNDDEIELPTTILELKTKVAERLWGRISDSIEADRAKWANQNNYLVLKSFYSLNKATVKEIVCEVFANYN